MPGATVVMDLGPLGRAQHLFFPLTSWEITDRAGGGNLSPTILLPTSRAGKHPISLPQPCICFPRGCCLCWTPVYTATTSQTGRGLGEQ